LTIVKDREHKEGDKRGGKVYILGERKRSPILWGKKKGVD